MKTVLHLSIWFVEYAYNMVNAENLVPQPAGGEMPSTIGLVKKISSFKGKKAFEIVPADFRGREFGNHGDALMYRVFEYILREAEIILVASPEDADFLLVRPNGALLESYNFPAILASSLKELPDIPLVIFPSSALFPSQDPSFMFEGRQAETLWIFREPFSYEHINSKWGGVLKNVKVNLALDHDVVASGHQYVHKIIGEPLQKKNNIIAGRLDGEASRSFNPFKKKTQPVDGSIILGIKRKVISLISSNPDTFLSRRLSEIIYRKRLDLAADSLMQALPEEVAHSILSSKLPLKKVDLSNQIFVSFEKYLEELRNADIVVTDRLHVALPAAIVGKKVILVEAGYHKLSGVYKQSLLNMPNVSLVNAYNK